MSAETAKEAAESITAYKAASSVAKKQRPAGVWAGNMMGLAPSAAQGIRDVGTIAQYRRLLQLGWPVGDRTFKLTSRLLFRLLSRDEDPALLFEYRKRVKEAPRAEEWVRDTIREAASAALAEAGFNADPRLRGSAHRIASAISQFLRSPQSSKPLVKVGQQRVLDESAYPPTWYSLAMVASMPRIQRERAGFTERLGQYLAHPAPKLTYSVKLGKKSVKPAHILLGNPIQADAKGVAKDTPLALYYVELLSRIGILQTAPVSMRVLARLMKDVDENGVWHPKNLRAQPKAGNPASYHYYPLLAGGKAIESRQADITFRLALIAKLLGWELEYS